MLPKSTKSTILLVLVGVTLVLAAWPRLSASPAVKHGWANHPWRPCEDAGPDCKWATRDSGTGGEKLIVYYFHGGISCVACRNIEAYAREAIESGFNGPVQSGQIEWRVVDYEQPENEHFAADFGLISVSVVLVRTRGGRQVDWKKLPEVWELVDDREAFVRYVCREVQVFLDGRIEPPPEGGVARSTLLGALWAFWLGLLTSISPCPLATNIAAVSYMGRRVGSPRQVLWTGLLYTLGRTLVYVALGVAVVAGLFSAPEPPCSCRST